MIIYWASKNLIAYCDQEKEQSSEELKKTLFQHLDISLFRIEDFPPKGPNVYLPDLFVEPVI